MVCLFPSRDTRSQTPFSLCLMRKTEISVPRCVLPSPSCPLTLPPGDLTPLTAVYRFSPAIVPNEEDLNEINAITGNASSCLIAQNASRSFPTVYPQKFIPNHRNSTGKLLLVTACRIIEKRGRKRGNETMMEEDRRRYRLIRND